MSSDAMTPGDPNWFSYVEPPLEIDDADAVEWFDTADVVVVGFGGAGACAALEARSCGADVLAIDRFSGGGATSVSGGVYYGGGTRIQKEAGIDDSAEELYKYLKLETQGIVTDETLRKFCNDSGANLDWLAEQGVPFSSSVYEKKTVYPPEGYFLYYAGNEQLRDYRVAAKPAPRGHRTAGKGITCGNEYFAALRVASERAGVRVLPHSPVTRLIRNGRGMIIGVEVKHLSPGSEAHRKHEKGYKRFQRLTRLLKPQAIVANKKFEEMERSHGQRKLIRARRGVVLATGSFAYNRDMIRYYAPGYDGTMPAASAGCDGSGIRLGQTVGGVTAQMSTVSTWRAISPPLSFIDGIIVNKRGERFVEEDSYSGRLGLHIGEHQDHTAYLIVDRKSYVTAFKEALKVPPRRFLYEAVPIFATLWGNCKTGKTLQEVAAHYALPADVLERTVKDYNQGAEAGVDRVGKANAYLRALRPGPYYIIDISTGNQVTLAAAIPMGGLRVNERSGAVLNADGSDIAGLYAAGRNAIGIPSHFYVSGTSIADCVFAGRRAGAHAAVVKAGVAQPLTAIAGLT